MTDTISYGPSVIGAQVTNVAITNVETKMLEIKDPRYLQLSQVSLYLTPTLGSGATKIYFRHYFSFDGGTTYYQVPIVSLSTGEIINLPDEFDSNSPASYVRDLPASGANAYKLTAQTDAGVGTLTTGTVLHRDN